MENKTLITAPQLTKIIVKKAAQEADLIIGKKYLIGIDGGLSTAQYIDYYKDIYIFSYKTHLLRLDTLEGVYVI